MSDNKEVKKFMKERGYSGYTNDHGIRKNYKARRDWGFKELSDVLNEYRIWKRKNDP